MSDKGKEVKHKKSNLVEKKVAKSYSLLPSTVRLVAEVACREGRSDSALVEEVILHGLKKAEAGK